MKLRIKGASLRLRLTRGEVQAFAETGTVEAVTPFGPGRTLTYALEASEAADAVTARFDGARVTVLLPAAAAHRWANTDEVGIEAEQAAGADRLHILVEKDFQCLHREDDRRDPDAYPHPLADSASEGEHRTP